jgi:hypothetical protein
VVRDMLDGIESRPGSLIVDDWLGQYWRLPSCLRKSAGNICNSPAKSSDLEMDLMQLIDVRSRSDVEERSEVMSKLKTEEQRLRRLRAAGRDLIPFRIQDLSKAISSTIFNFEHFESTLCILELSQAPNLI